MKKFDDLIDYFDLIGFFKLRDFFELIKDDYIVKLDVLRVIKKYYKIVFKFVYW